MSSALAEEFRGTARFSIVRRLGAGGMGVVYEAFDRERQVIVALKTLIRFDAHALYQFKREFRALTELVHENVISLYELISDGGQWFFTMELVEDGADLLSFLDEHIGALGQRTEPRTPDTASMNESWLASTTVSLGSADGGDTVNDLGHAPGSDSGIDTGETRQMFGPLSGAGAPDKGTPRDPAPAPHAPAAGPALPPLPTALATSPPRDYARLRAVFAQLAAGVEALHAAGKLHRDLKPTNVLVRRETGRVMLLDFGLVVDLEPMAQAEPGAAAAGGRELDSESTNRRVYQTVHGHLAGTIAYMAPEQARGAALTEASDWYAVGVMLYQALTGTLPITGTAMQMLYQKQIVDPEPPRRLVADVPEDLEALCLALLARVPEERPSGADVLARLAGGRRAPTVTGPGPVDIGEVLPFVGRARHLDALRRALDVTLSGGTVVYRVHGASGAGKSTLIQHFLDEATRAHGAVVLAGRCYEQESVPYKAVDSLIDALTRWLLGCPAELQAALLPGADDLGPLSRLFPVLRRIPAVDAAAEVLGPTSDLRALRQHAFAALRRLLTRLGERRPLVLYIDDLQWGDVDSAALLAELLGPPDPPRLCLLAAYRSEYAESSECLRALAASALAHDPALHRGELAVEPLAPEHARELAEALLRAQGLEIEHADWIVRESRGSALYVQELVRYLQSGRDLSAVAGQDLDSVLRMRVAELPEEARRLVEVVAVAGQPVKLRHAQDAAELGTLPQRTLSALRSGNLVRTSGPGLDDVIECFHDRVRESVVARLGMESSSAYHLGLATALERAGDTDPETIAAHYLGAGASARAGHYYELAAEHAAASLAFDRAEAFYSLAMELAGDDEARVRLCEKRIHFYTDVARFEDAYACAREGLALLGVKLPSSFVPPLFVADFAWAALRLRGRDVASLADLPRMRGARLESAVRLMSGVAKAAYQIRPELCVAVATKIVNLCLKHGNTPDCAIGYMVFGAIFQGGVLGRHRVGYDFGRLALSIVERYGNDRQRAEVNFVVGYFGTSWLRPATEAEALWRVAYQSGLETGDLFHTGCAACGLVLGQYMRGAPLDDVWATSESVRGDLERAGLRIPLGAITAVRQAIRNLRGQTAGPASFSDDAFDEGAFVAALPGWGIRHFEHFYYLCKMQALYLRGAWDEALALAGRAAPYRKESRGMLHGAEHGFLHALILAGAYQGGRRARAHLRQLRKEHRALARLAAQCPTNFAAKERLVAAELAACEGAEAEALARYAQAVEAAHAHGQLHVEAMACGRVGQMLAASGQAEAAQPWLEQARAGFRRWGAYAYAESLG
jgi:serine/threonine protein kinase/predicted ATPase